MPPHAATTFDREHVQIEAHIARTAESSRHEISVLALELLQQRLRAQHLRNIETHAEVMEYLEKKQLADATTLASEHDKEATELEDVRFALFEEFDVKRQAWATAMKQLLDDEKLKQAEVIESLTAKFNGDRKMQRISRHAERLASLQSDQQLRQIELRNQQRLVRVKIEEEYHVQLDELQQNCEAVQKRQIEQRQLLAGEHEVERAEALNSFRASEVKLEDERRRVEEWWTYLNKDATECRRQINENEQQILGELECIEAAAVSEEKGLDARFEARDSFATTTVASASKADVQRGADTSEEAASPDASQAVAELTQAADTATPPFTAQDRLEDGTITTVTISDVTEKATVPPVVTADDSPTYVSITTPPHPAFAEIDGLPSSEDAILKYPGSPFVHAGIDSPRTVRCRSGSASSVGSESDFVEI